MIAIAGLVAVLGAAAYVIASPKHVDRAGAVIGFSAPPVISPLRVVVLRGGATGCTQAGGCNEANYAQVLSAKEGWTTTVVAQGGTGYVNGSDNKPPDDYGAELPKVYAANPDLVIVEGSVSDQYYSGAAVEQAAVSVFTSLKAHLPDAKIVVVGPAWAGPAPANVVAIEGALEAACAGRVAQFIDPIAEGWFSGANASLMGSDHESLTDQGHAHMAAMIAAELTPLLHQQPSSSSPAT